MKELAVGFLVLCGIGGISIGVGLLLPESILEGTDSSMMARLFLGLCLVLLGAAGFILILIFSYLIGSVLLTGNNSKK